MIPLHDDTPTTIRPMVTIGLIVACVLAFLWQLALPPLAQQRAIFALGFIPGVFFGDQRLPAEIAWIPSGLSLLTSMFLHGGWLHLLGNMLYLWIFGNNVEDAMGHVKFLLFYLLCGVIAALTQGFTDPEVLVPMVGASGAIGGVLGAYIVLHPHARILVLIPLGFFITTARIPALLVLGLWFVLQFIQGSMVVGEQGGIAFWAHIGGFISGAVLVVPFRDKSVPLFGRRRRGPWD
ncbi:rhomboid family intramembrane serine protease [Rhodospirillaceae bacterium SYSU D60014]|uniref:rhomboid family intramembrane serine protease n=1 Tax=Virgifigura deserti TaxID=2268457 RepID=UPI000E668BC4